ncbi:dienelactone hydrolase family protein [Propionivibrio dicarboxylicus]|uniref:Dienelactone hydrolase n=1 Tax=Propionivibrio dicarboxylicus TaxID=83767 RepID=A0A1G7VR85_9RHOO|nr:prolyl oligopeptidase family serine peptidase [Propionivibrio dicarboxylicus]SDG62326.1 Dienelactone hydrolase [Propionivibrio dicarboxylicus]
MKSSRYDECGAADCRPGHRVRLILVRGWLVFFCLLPFPVFAAEPMFNKSLNEAVVFIPNGSGPLAAVLETTFFRPDGDGPFPLVVINHGKASGNPRFQSRARYIVASRELVRRGYAVMIPMRGGFSRSSGNYISGGCNIEANGLSQARDVRAALDYATQLPYVDPTRIVVMGQSHGGLTTLALGTKPYAGVRGLVNFAGGLRKTECLGWERLLVDAFRSYGETNRLPSLWFYGDNDSYWSPETRNAMLNAYVGAGGNVRMVAFGKFGTDAHGLFGHRDGWSIWWPEVEKFLAELGLPTQVLPRTASADPARIHLEAVAASMRWGARCQNAFNDFVDADYPRAFAWSASVCSVAVGGENPGKRALDLCRSRVPTGCQLFAVDDAVLAAN